MKPSDKNPMRNANVFRETFNVGQIRILFRINDFLILSAADQSVAREKIRRIFRFGLHAVKIDKTVIQIPVDKMSYLMEKSKPESVGAFPSERNAQNRFSRICSFDETLNRSSPEMPDNAERDAAFGKNVSKIFRHCHRVGFEHLFLYFGNRFAQPAGVKPGGGFCFPGLYFAKPLPGKQNVRTERRCCSRFERGKRRCK